MFFPSLFSINSNFYYLIILSPAAQVIYKKQTDTELPIPDPRRPACPSKAERAAARRGVGGSPARTGGRVCPERPGFAGHLSSRPSSGSRLPVERTHTPTSVTSHQPGSLNGVFSLTNSHFRSFQCLGKIF